jgi:hypothetical protein
MTIYWIYMAVYLLSMAVMLAITAFIKIVVLRYEQLDIRSVCKAHRDSTVRLVGLKNLSTVPDVVIGKERWYLKNL